jgi:hypothetical protein
MAFLQEGMKRTLHYGSTALFCVFEGRRVRIEVGLKHSTASPAAMPCCRYEGQGDVTSQSYVSASRATASVGCASDRRGTPLGSMESPKPAPVWPVRAKRRWARLETTGREAAAFRINPSPLRRPPLGSVVRRGLVDLLRRHRAGDVAHLLADVVAALPEPKASNCSLM